MKINIDKLSLEVINQLEAYQKITTEDVTRAVKETAKELVQEIRAAAPKDSGDYSKSWAYKRDPNLRGKWRYSMVVYSRAPEYRITHLLEHGYAKVSGGRVDGHPHIGSAEQRAKAKLVAKIKEAMSR